MKSFISCLFLISALSLNAQKTNTEVVKQTIELFFEAFHKQDTTTLRTLVKGDIKLQSITTNDEGKSVINESNFNQFLKNIASIPKDKSFEEKIKEFNIQVDGAMANVWMPYEFWYQDKFSHCGVNSFQLLKENDQWLIFFLVDTRRRDDCKR